MNDLPDDLRDWVETAASTRVVSARRHLAGASREAWSLETERGGLFLMRDGRPGSGGSARDAAVLRALAGSPVPVPLVYGNDAERSTVLLSRVDGRGDFPEVDDEAEREPTARHLMELTAALHAIDPSTLDIAHLGPPPPPDAHAETQLVHARGAVQMLGDDAPPVLAFAVAWLGRNLPTPPPATSLVHSDMGPGNFISGGGRVRAVLDWEVAHWGDAMEDLAAVSIRDMATPVGDLPTRFAEYEAAAAAPVRVDAVKWYRVFVLTRNSAFITLGLRADPNSPGSSQLQMHRLNLMRAAALTLCDAIGLPRPAEPSLAGDPDDPSGYSAAEQQADLAAMTDLLGTPPADVHDGWRSVRALFDDRQHDRALAEFLARHMLRRGMVGAAILGPLVDRLPQPLERALTIHGNDPALVVTEADDEFHPPTTDDPSWIETAWFPFWIPEIEATVHARLWWRPNAGQQGGAVTAWRGANEIIGYDGWTEDFAGFGDLRALTLANGFELHCAKPLDTYVLRHRSKRVELDIEFRALMAANPVSPDESPGMFLGHLEQPGRVIGTVRLGGTTYEIDCGSVRDRSWGPRTMRPGLRIGNAHGTAVDGRAFFVYVNPDTSGTERITSGYWQHDGRAAHITSGVRTTDYDGNFPVAVTVEATDALGRTLVARGRCANRQAVDAGHDLYAVLNLIEWDLGDGHAWGENHDIWAKADWLAAGRSELPSR